jgi:superfamily II DNA or RNA helicase
MLSLLILAKCEKVLVIVPTDPLREQISKKFIELGLLKTLKILDETAFHPVVGVLKKSFSNSDEATEFFAKCNVIVATASILSRVNDEIFPIFIGNFSHIFINEAHHAEARTWFKIRDKFKDKKILQFTATPYREDGNHPAKKIIYNYPLKKAQNEGYFKTIDVFSIYEYEPKKSDLAIAEIATLSNWWRKSIGAWKR